MLTNTELSRSIITSLGNTAPIAREEETNETIYLRNNENPFGGEYRRYPGYTQDGLNGLAERYLNLIQELERDCGARPLSLHAGNVLLTQGAASALEQVFKTFFEPGLDSVVLTPPCFSIFSRVANIYNIASQTIPLMGKNHDRLNVNAICQSGAKGVVLCDPNNPIGCRIHSDDISNLLDNFKGLVVIDEAYVEYSQHPSNLERLDSYPNLLIIRTMSKALGMAGLRIGAAIGSEAVIQAMSKVQLPFAISSVAASKASAALTHKAQIKTGIIRFRKERNRIYESLTSLPCITGIWGNEGGFITIRVSHLNEVEKKLRNSRIEPVYNPEGLAGYIRISIGTELQNTILIESLRSISL